MPHDRTNYPPSRPRRRRRADASPWHWLLFVPIVVPLLTPLYNRVEPALFGLPFYYYENTEGGHGFAQVAELLLAAHVGQSSSQG